MNYLLLEIGTYDYKNLNWPFYRSLSFTFHEKWNAASFKKMTCSRRLAARGGLNCFIVPYLNSAHADKTHFGQ